MTKPTQQWQWTIGSKVLKILLQFYLLCFIILPALRNDEYRILLELFILIYALQVAYLLLNWRVPDQTFLSEQTALVILPS